MTRVERLTYLTIALVIATALVCIADCLCEMTPTVTVQLIPCPESSGDKAATTGSE